MTVAPPLSALVITMSSLSEKFLSAFISPFVRLFEHGGRFSWFQMSSMTADSNVSIVLSTFFGVNELFLSFNCCKIVGLYSEFPKCALSLIRLKKALRSSSSAVVLNLGGRGQKFKPLSNKLNTCKEKVCLLKFIIRPFGSFLNLQASRSFFVVERKLLACLLVGLGSPRPCCLFGGLIGFLGVFSLFLDRGCFYLVWVVVFGWLSALGFQRRCGSSCPVFCVVLLSGLQTHRPLWVAVAVHET